MNKSYTVCLIFLKPYKMNIFNITVYKKITIPICIHRLLSEITHRLLLEGCREPFVDTTIDTTIRKTMIMNVIITYCPKIG